MLFKRVMSTDQAGLPQVGRQGQGLLGNISIAAKTTDENHTLTVAEMAGGAVYYSALSAGRQVTTPTAALILAAAPDMDIGDSFCFWVSIQDAFAITWVAGDGVTLAGRATTAASGSSLVVVTKTAATTVTWTIL
jgi:threonine dehydratase